MQYQSESKGRIDNNGDAPAKLVAPPAQSSFDLRREVLLIFDGRPDNAACS